MTLRRFYRNWHAGFAWYHWHVGLSRYDDGWLFVLGPFGVAKLAKPLPMVGLVGLLTDEQKAHFFERDRG